MIKKNTKMSSVFVCVWWRRGTLDARGLLAHQRATSVRASSACRLSFAASPLNSVTPNEKKTSGTQGRGGGGGGGVDREIVTIQDARKSENFLIIS